VCDGYCVERDPQGNCITWGKHWVCGCEGGGGGSKPSPRCDISLSQRYQITLGIPISVNPNVTTNGYGSLENVTFEITNGGDFVCIQIPNTRICTSQFTDNAAPFSAVLKGKRYTQQLARLKASCRMNNGFVNSAEADIEIVNPSAWWRVIQGDVVSKTSTIVSRIPQLCDESGTCHRRDFIYGLPPANSGIPIAAGTTFFGEGYPSSADWDAELVVNPSQDLDYNFFAAKIPTQVLSDPNFNTSDSELTQDDLTSQGKTFAGYRWIRYRGSGNLSIGRNTNTTINLNSKVILFVEGNVTTKIKSKIRLQDPGSGSGFYLISKGDVVIDKDLGDQASNSPDTDVEAIIFTERNFITESKGQYQDLQLKIRGSVVASGFSLERSLDNNADHPAEIFEFAPDIVLTWPKFLSKKPTVWREVTP